MYDGKTEDDAEHHYQQRRGGGGPRRNNYNEEKDPESEQFRKLFIGGLSYETTEDSLKRHFEQWGEIVDCVVMRDPGTKRSRGFGFITYKQAYMVDEAQKHRPHKIDNREVESKRAMPREESGNSVSQASVKKIFVGGIKEDTTEDQIRSVFSQFGSLESVEMIKEKGTDKVRGFCFVTFDDYDAVDKAVLIKRHDVNGRKVEVKKALSRSEMNQGGSMRGGRGPMMGRAMGGGGRFGGGRGEWGGQGGGYGGGYGGGNYNQDYADGRSSRRNGDRRTGGYSGGYGNQGGGGYGGGYNSGGSGGGGGGWNQGGGGGGGGYDSFGGGYNQGGGNWNNQNSFGSGYGDSYGGGAIKGGGYSQRGQGPYGSGYGNSSGGGGGGYGSGGGGGYGGGYRR